MAFASRNEESRRQRLEDREFEQRYHERVLEENEELLDTGEPYIQPNTPSAQSDISIPEVTENSADKKKTTSAQVRTHFAATADKSLKCNHCSRIYPKTSSATTLQYHLRVEHPSQWKKIKSDAEKPKEIPACFRPAESSAPSLAKNIQKEGEDLLVRLLSPSSLPFSIVDGPEFRELLTFLNPSFKLPSRNTMKQRILDQYVSSKAEIIELLKSAPGRISITLDAWTSIVSESYFPLTAHWIDKDWNIVSVLLDFIYIQKRHTAENIMALIMAALKDYQIQDKMISFITDGASNMKAACEKPNFLLDALKNARQIRGKANCVPEVWLRCLAHALHLSVTAGLKKKAEVIGRLREIVVTLKRSRAVEDFRLAAHRKDIGLKLDCPTRWNSTFYMCKRGLSIRSELDECFASASGYEHFLMNEEWAAIAELTSLLEPFEKVSREFSSSTEPTLHLAISYLTEILRHLEEMHTTSQKLRQ